jgi:hypothetical protein
MTARIGPRHQVGPHLQQSPSISLTTRVTLIALSIFSLGILPPGWNILSSLAFLAVAFSSSSPQPIHTMPHQIFHASPVSRPLTSFICSLPRVAQPTPRHPVGPRQFLQGRMTLPTQSLHPVGYTPTPFMHIPEATLQQAPRHPVGVNEEGPQKGARHQVGIKP